MKKMFKLSSTKKVLTIVVNKLKKNKKKIVIGLSVFLIVFISVFSFINLRYPTKINAYIAHVINKGEPANSYFDDEVFYKAIVDSYNKENKTSLPYTTNLTDEQLKSIKSIYYSGSNKSDSEKIRSAKGIEKLINLERLDLGPQAGSTFSENSNLIKKIDLSSNSKLKVIDLTCNNINNIVLGNNIALKGLYLGFNNISNIDLSKNTSLIYLSLDRNNLSNIDLSNNTTLTNLNLDYNKISSIDLSKNMSLTVLDLGYNDINNINLSYNTSLTELYLYHNNLSNIDLSKNIALKKLSLGGNKISSIDLNNNTSLTELSLSNNNISNIDLSQNTALTRLHLNKNSLSNIDLSKYTTLTELGLSNNNLSNIDLSNNTSLTELDLSNNNLSNIDLSNNTFLKYLYLNSNNLSNIDLSKNIKLTYMKLDNNDLSSIKLYDNFDISKLKDAIKNQNTYQTNLDLGSNRIINLTKDYKYYFSKKIIIPSEVDLQTFIDNLGLQNLTAKIFNDDEEISSGKIKYGYILKLYYEDIEVDSVTIKIFENSAFNDEVFYKAVVDAYNKENKTSLPYATNLTDEQLSSIKSVSYSGYKKSDLEKIKSTTGIEKLTSLVSLELRFNNLSNIDLSKNTSLTKLYLGFNKISSIDLSKNTALTSLKLSNNNLCNINLSKNITLTELSLYEDEISRIDLSKNTALTDLELEGNNISNIDLSKNTNLTNLILSGDNINRIDLSKNIALEGLELGSDNISNIDLSKNINLKYLALDNNKLSSIDLSKNTKLSALYLYNNPLKLNAYVKENGTLTSSSIKMPEGSDKFYLTYEIEDNSIANFADNKLNGLKVGKTNATVTLNGVKASSSSTENMKVDGTITVFDRLKGDISNDDKITIADVSLLYRHVRGTKVIEDSKTLEISDLTGDGKITIADVAKLYRYVRGKINEL